MKKMKWLSLATLVAALTACGSGSNNGETADSTTTATTTTTEQTTNTSSGNYAAMADSFRVNSEAGNYLDARTGRPLRLRYDEKTRRAVNEETGEPVWRYVDRRTWWVYGPNEDRWDTIGTARMQNQQLQYRGTNTDEWLDYERRWHEDDERWMTEYNNGEMNGTKSGTDVNAQQGNVDASAGTTDGKLKVKDNGKKIKDENIKVKVSDDGDIKVKNKQTGEKVKYDADDRKVKTDNK